MSSRLRITLIFVVTVAVLLSVFSVNIYYSTLYIRKNSFYDRLWERLEMYENILKQNIVPGTDSIDVFMRKSYWTELTNEEVVFYNPSGNEYRIADYYNSAYEYTQIIENLPESGKTETHIDHRHIVVSKVEVDGQEYIILISGYDRNGIRLIHRLKMTLIFSNLAFIIIIIIVGWLFAGAAFKPVVRIVEAAEKIGYQDLHLRVPLPKSKGEVFRLANALNDSFDRIQDAFTVQKSFVTHASHELRTPLTSLRGNLEVALLSNRSTEEYKTLISNAVADTIRLGDLLEKLFLLSQTEHGKHFFEFTPVRIDELIQDVRLKSIKNHPGRNIEIRYLDAPSDEKSITISGNTDLLDIAFSNILDNALKYSEAPTNIVVEISTQNNIEFNITDQGRGIAMKDMQHIFEPFFRSEQVREVQGYGIGLTLAKQIILIHGGAISVKSRIISGTTVEISLPSEL